MGLDASQHGERVVHQMDDVDFLRKVGGWAHTLSTHRAQCVDEKDRITGAASTGGRGFRASPWQGGRPLLVLRRWGGSQQAYADDPSTPRCTLCGGSDFVRRDRMHEHDRPSKVGTHTRGHSSGQDAACVCRSLQSKLRWVVHSGVH